MTVRLTPRSQPQSQIVIGGVDDLFCDGATWHVGRKTPDHYGIIWQHRLSFGDIAAIELDNDDAEPTPVAIDDPVTDYLETVQRGHDDAGTLDP